MPQMKDSQKVLEGEWRKCQVEMEKEQLLMFSASIEHTQSETPPQKGIVCV